MKIENKIEPIKDELPSSYADRLGVYFASQVTETHKKKNGQFFTPLCIARFMANLNDCKKAKVKILDPGCGSGVLSCSLVEELFIANRNLQQVELVVYETDENLRSFANQSLRYLKQWLEKKDIKFDFILIDTDFILSNSVTLENQNHSDANFDLVISNPPYFKLSKTDGRVRAVENVVHGQPNIYSIFLYIAATLLADDGQLIFIVPRSFASGYYFRLFREKFFSIVQLNKVHLFDSRKEAFGRDEVLQENVIISAYRTKANGIRSLVMASFSTGLKDLNQRQVTEFYLDELLDTGSYQRILHLPTSQYETEVVRLFKSWQGSLALYNIQISTGPVVAFRAKQFIHSEQKQGLSLTSLYWLHHTFKMKLLWPLNKKGKGDYIQICDQSLSLLIPNKHYVLLRRFSSKDDHSRLIAAPYYADSNEADLIGVENHLNYIYRPGGNLDRNEILGLAVLLNSNLFDTYFRTFNGNINVSATEMREMPFPPLETIKQIGNVMLIKNDFSQEAVDAVVEQFFELQGYHLAIHE